MAVDVPLWEIAAPYAGLLSLATISIYCGSFGTLSTARKPGQKFSASESEEEEEENSLTETLSSGDAYLFPIFGSVALGGIYLVLKYLGKEWVNYLLSWYFAILGVGSVWKTGNALLKTVLGRKTWNSLPKYKLLLLQGHRELFNLPIPLLSVLLLPFSTLPSIFYSLNSKSALFTNILALSFSHTTMGLLKLDGFKTGTILLAGLFFYDIWWVFGTEVMLKVATSLDAPIKILWPKSLAFSASNGFAMLGLGDIVVPGVFIACALRFDQYQHKSSKSSKNTNFSKPYFTAILIAYVIGLSVTMFVANYYQNGQPALLYLSPACILSFVLTAISRGELSKAWKWADDDDTSNKVEDVPKADPPKELKEISAKLDEAEKEVTSAPPQVLAPEGDAGTDADADGEEDGDDVDKDGNPKGKRRRRKARK